MYSMPMGWSGLSETHFCWNTAEPMCTLGIVASVAAFLLFTTLQNSLLLSAGPLGTQKILCIDLLRLWLFARLYRGRLLSEQPSFGFLCEHSHRKYPQAFPYAQAGNIRVDVQKHSHLYLGIMPPEHSAQDRLGRLPVESRYKYFCSLVPCVTWICCESRHNFGGSCELEWQCLFRAVAEPALAQLCPLARIEMRDS